MYLEPCPFHRKQIAVHEDTPLRRTCRLPGLKACLRDPLSGHFATCDMRKMASKSGGNGSGRLADVLLVTADALAGSIEVRVG